MNSAGGPQLCSVVVSCVGHVQSSICSSMVCTRRYLDACGGLRLLFANDRPHVKHGVKKQVPTINGRVSQ